MNKNIEKYLDILDGEIERIRAFAENLAITEDYKMDVCFDEEGRCWEKLDIDASEISKDLLDLVEVAHDKLLDLKLELNNIDNEENT